MSADLGFLIAIVADPSGDTDRLIYADWLDDHGENDKATFLRAECEIHKLRDVGDSSFRYCELRQTMANLMESIGADWLTRMARVMLTLVSYPPERSISMIKVVREVTGYGLAEMKAISQQIPLPLMQFYLWEHAEKMQGYLASHAVEASVAFSSAHQELAVSRPYSLSPRPILPLPAAWPKS